MSVENEIRNEVEVLKSRFSETKALYREVCAVLFFRHGITPTANMLYQHVRKGSMSAPAEALAKFWEDLRSKTAVQLDHPGLPDDLKPVAAEAVKGIWHVAVEHAKAELSGIRVELKHQSDQLAADRLALTQQLSIAEKRSLDSQAETAAAVLKLEDFRDQLERERRGQAATEALLTAAQQQVDALREQLDRARADFRTDLAKAQEAVLAADGRADGAQRKALVEVEQERLARGKADKRVEALRDQLAQAEVRLRDVAVKAAAERAQLRGEIDIGEQAVARLQETVALGIDDNRKLQDQLAAQREQVIQASAQADATRQLLAQFRGEDAGPRARKKAARAVP